MPKKQMEVFECADQFLYIILYPHGRRHNFAKMLAVLEVLTLVRNELDCSALGATDLLVRWLASPVNPLDINIIEGTYAFRPLLPCVAGSEAVGRVEQIGPQVSGFSVGDRVMTFRGQGIWTDYDIIDQSALIRIKENIDLISAATLRINPSTAYILLTHFEKLAPGDYVIQNAANSAVGRAVIQLAKAFDYRTINLVRQRPNLDALKEELLELGADYVFAENEFLAASRTFLKTQVDRPVRLALNGVGGRSALLVSSALGYGGTMVTYGGMSRRPHEISTTALLFNNVKVIGFMVGAYLADERNVSEAHRIYTELMELIGAGRLRPPPMDLHEVDAFRVALRQHVDPHVSQKQMIFFDAAALREAKRQHRAESKI